jgi:hypothetical protein
MQALEIIVNSDRVRVIDLSQLIYALDEIVEFLEVRRVDDEAFLGCDDAIWMLEWVAEAADQLQRERDRVIACADIGGAS